MAEGKNTEVLEGDIVAPDDSGEDGIGEALDPEDLDMDADRKDGGSTEILGQEEPFEPTKSGEDLDAVYDVPGRSSMQVGQLLELGRGAIVELDRKAGEAIDVYVNNRPVARGGVAKMPISCPRQQVRNVFSARMPRSSLPATRRRVRAGGGAFPSG